jgi:DNA polymerase
MMDSTVLNPQEQLEDNPSISSMHLNDQQGWYLHAMDIDQWVLRDNTNRVSKLISSTSMNELNDRKTAIAQMDWDTLEKTVQHCTACPLHETRTHAVFGVGRRDADLLIIGEAPGANEDKQGEPFVGRAGKLLNSMLEAIGLNRQEVYIANIVKSRPPQNRDPLPEEVAACTPYLLRQITLLKPKIMLALGRIAAHYLLDTTTPMGRLRGHTFEYGPLKTPLLITYHPAYLLRSPREKRKAWQDMQLLQQLLFSHISIK